MSLKKLWEEDEAEKAAKRERKQKDLFTLQDAAWEAEFLLDDRCSFARSLKERMAHLYGLIDRREQELDQEFRDLNDF